MNRTFATLVGAAALAIGAPVLAQEPSPSPVSAEVPDPAELAEATAIIEIMFPLEEREATFKSLIGDVMGQFMQASTLPEIDDPGLKGIFQDYLAALPDRLMPVVQTHLPRILDATAISYTREFSLEELRDIHAFALTPAGKHYLSRSSALLGDPAVAAANTAYMVDIQAYAQESKGELIQALTAYVEEHPEVLQEQDIAGQPEPGAGS